MFSLQISRHRNDGKWIISCTNWLIRGICRSELEGLDCDVAKCFMPPSRAANLRVRNRIHTFNNKFIVSINIPTSRQDKSKWSVFRIIFNKCRLKPTRDHNIKMVLTQNLAWNQGEEETPMKCRTFRWATPRSRGLSHSEWHMLSAR
jgi:hypothetical protein